MNFDPKNLARYHVGDQTYYLKLDAAYHASQTNQDIVLDFYNNVFGSINWTQRPSGTLAEAYRDRAQQIRDRYDYVVVQFSGGMDSWYALHSFLSNGIHVDEVYSRWPLVERKYQSADKNNIDESNLGSEFEFAALPVLEYVRKNFPRTHVVVDDYSEDLSNNEFILPKVGVNSTAIHHLKWNRRSQYEQEQERRNSNIGIVLGCDKISIAVESGNFYAYFTDAFQSPEIGGRNYEYFYWTPDFPTLPILQAHYLKDYLSIAGNQNLHREYRELYRTVCYPDFDPTTFRVGKQLGNVVFKSTNWVYQHNPKLIKSWKWSMDQYFNGMDDKFISRLDNGLKVGTRTVESPRYLVAENTGIPNIRRDVNLRSILS
jgi:hypothetical protein